ncbi:MAG: hypothetical protein AAF206_05435, partial [Bacteroidota bacterium]
EIPSKNTGLLLLIETHSPHPELEKSWLNKIGYPVSDFIPWQKAESQKKLWEPWRLIGVPPAESPPKN